VSDGEAAAAIDDPDLSIRSDHLVDDPDAPGEIKTVTHGDSFYTSGAAQGGWVGG
jgi:hypothetical protein